MISFEEHHISGLPSPAGVFLSFKRIVWLPSKSRYQNSASAPLLLATQPNNRVNSWLEFMQARVTRVTKENDELQKKLFTRLAESGQNRIANGLQQWGCSFAWSPGLILCTYSKWHRFSRLDHFWLGRTDFGCQSWSARTKFRRLKLVRPDHFLPRTKIFVTGHN